MSVRTLTLIVVIGLVASSCNKKSSSASSGSLAEYAGTWVKSCYAQDSSNNVTETIGLDADGTFTYSQTNFGSSATCDNAYKAFTFEVSTTVDLSEESTVVDGAVNLDATIVEETLTPHTTFWATSYGSGCGKTFTVNVPTSVLGTACGDTAGEKFYDILSLDTTVTPNTITLGKECQDGDSSPCEDESQRPIELDDKSFAKQ